MTREYPIVYMYHTFFIHFSIDEHLGCFCVDYCKQFCIEHWGACVFLNYGFLWVYTQNWNCWVIPIFSFLRNLHTILHSDYQFTVPPTEYEGSVFSTPSPEFIVCGFFDDRHSDQCEVIPHCSFDLHFSSN